MTKAGQEIKQQKPPIIRKLDGTKYYFFSGSPTKDRYGNNLLDNEVIKFLVDQHEFTTGTAVNVIRAAFIEGTELYENSYFYDRYHIQVAIMNEDYADFSGSNDGIGVRNFEILPSSDLNARYNFVKRKHWP